MPPHAAAAPTWVQQQLGCQAEAAGQQQQQQLVGAHAAAGSAHDLLLQQPAQGKTPREQQHEQQHPDPQTPGAEPPAASTDGAALTARRAAAATAARYGLPLGWAATAVAAAAVSAAAVAVATAVAAAAAAPAPAPVDPPAATTAAEQPPAAAAVAQQPADKSAATQPAAEQPAAAAAPACPAPPQFPEFQLVVGSCFDPVFPQHQQPRQQQPQPQQHVRKREQEHRRQASASAKPQRAQRTSPAAPAPPPPGTTLLQLPPALLQQIAAGLPPACRASRVAAASACKRLRAAVLCSIPALCLRPQQLAQVYACKQQLYGLHTLAVDLRQGRFIWPHILQNSLLGAAARLPNLRSASLTSISSAKLPMAATLLQLPQLRQLTLAGRGGSLQALPASLHGASSSSAGAGAAPAQQQGLQLARAGPAAGASGDGTAPRLAGITHLTLKRFNLTARSGAGRRRGRAAVVAAAPAAAPGPLSYAAVVAGASASAAGSSSGGSHAAVPPASPLLLLAGYLPNLTHLSLQQVVVGPHCLTALAPLAGSLRELSLCWLPQMRLQLSHVSVLTGLTALRLAGLALAPVLADDLDDLDDLEVAAGVAAGLAGNGGNLQDAGDGDWDADSDDGEAWDDDPAGPGGEPQQHQQHLSAAQLAALHAATAAHDEAVAAALARLPALRCLTACRCSGISGPLAAGLSELGQLAALAVPLPLRLQELPGAWAGWSRQLTSLQVPELLQTCLWQPQRPPLAALKALTVTGRLAAPDGFLQGFAPNLATLHAGFICSSKAAATAAGVAAPGASRPTALVGLATLAVGNCLQELAVLDCRPAAGTAANAAAMAAAAGLQGAAAAAAAAALAGAAPAADGAVPAAPGGGLAGLLAAAAQVDVGLLEVAGGLAAVADAAAAAGDEQLLQAARPLGGGAGAVPCDEDCQAVLLRLTGVQRLRLEQVAAGSRLAKQLPVLLCLWSDLRELRLRSLPSEFDGPALGAIVRQHASSLTCLSLASAPGIHWQSVTALAAASRLRSLALATLGQVTVCSVINAVTNMPHLTALRLEGLGASWSSRCSKDCPELAAHIPAALAVGRHWCSWNAWRNGDESGEAAPPAAAAAAPAPAGTGVPGPGGSASTSDGGGASGGGGSGSVAVSSLPCDSWEFSLGEGDRPALMAAAPQLLQLTIIP